MQVNDNPVSVLEFAGWSYTTGGYGGDCAWGVMIASLLAAVVLDPGVSDVAILGAIGFVVNLATTFQDVAVDGLSVDIMEGDDAEGADRLIPKTAHA